MCCCCFSVVSSLTLNILFLNNLGKSPSSYLVLHTILSTAFNFSSLQQCTLLTWQFDGWNDMLQNLHIFAPIRVYASFCFSRWQVRLSDKSFSKSRSLLSFILEPYDWIFLSCETVILTRNYNISHHHDVPHHLINVQLC